MMPPSALGALAARVTMAQDDYLADSPLFASTRRRVLSQPPMPPRRESWWVLAAYGLAGAAVAAGMLVWMRERPLKFETTGLSQQEAYPSGTMLASKGSGLLAFSDGSRVLVGPEGKVRVHALHLRGADIELARGELQASIVHRDNTDWQFHAGPFRVAIVGTEFSLKWDAQAEALTVAVHEGAVRVSGCSISGMAMAAGQQTTLRCNQGMSEAETAPASSAAPEPICSEFVPAPQAPAMAVKAGPAPTSAPAESSSAVAAEAPDAGAPDWRALAAKGKLRDAFAAAEAAGFEAECERSSGRELLELADAALLAGRMDRANAALLAARRRFAGTAHSAAAAYRLGRMAFDQRGALGDARNWFQVYLQEAPSGGLAREAAGRLVEIDLRTGNVAAAKARAEQYLRQYPDGPHAELARKVVAGP